MNDSGFITAGEVPQELPSGGTAGQVLKARIVGAGEESKYDLPKASGTELGGIKVGANLRSMGKVGSVRQIRPTAWRLSSSGLMSKEDKHSLGVHSG